MKKRNYMPRRTAARLSYLEHFVQVLLFHAVNSADLSHSVSYRRDYNYIIHKNPIFVKSREGENSKRMKLFFDEIHKAVLYSSGCLNQQKTKPT